MSMGGNLEQRREKRAEVELGGEAARIEAGRAKGKLTGYGRIQHGNIPL